MTVPTSRPAGTYPFDAAPLTAPVDRAALAAYSRSTPSAALSASHIIGLVFGGIFLLVLLSTFGTVAGAMLSAALGAAGFILTPVLIVVVLAAAVVGIVAWVRSRRIRAYRLETFAAANGMTYLPELADPQLPGMIFGLGHSRKSIDLVRGSSPRFVEFANYRYTTGSGKEAQTHNWGYIAIRLDVPLPNIVLDSLANNGFLGSNLPASYSRHQRLSLEGDFDRSFALYCPEGYERDALYLFTPDIMARFMDNAAAFDVEIVDDWLLLYAQNRQVSTLDPAAWAHAFATVSAVIDKLAQWARWRDERLSAAGQASPVRPGGSVSPAPAAFAGVAAPTPGPAGQSWAPPPGVAAPGRRLKRSIPWVSVVVIAFFGIAWFAMHLLALR
ncbi:hypothetical protein [Microbacterium sp. 22242]|uniref:hypothetical protein n=1 Tax=Microbacterium sp. 22242 TaxID=3453896 RepID=UPI003F828767